MTARGEPIFWRDPAMPYVELRSVADGRMVCYAPHTHTQWSIGAITAGQSTFVTGARHYRVNAGTLVLVNPDRVHAIGQQGWSYLMMYVDFGWLGKLVQQLGLHDGSDWRGTHIDTIRDVDLFQDYCRMAGSLLERGVSIEVKQSALLEFIAELFSKLGDAQAGGARPDAATSMPTYLAELLSHLDAHCDEEWSLYAMCQRTGCKPPQLIRTFKQHVQLTPHAYLINRRVQLAQIELKRGRTIAEAAVNAGFADQPHLQRVFKRLLGATPGQYQSKSFQDQ